MEGKLILFHSPEIDTDRLVGIVSSSLHDRGDEYSKVQVRKAILALVDSRIADFTETLAELLSDPGSNESQFVRLELTELDRKRAKETALAAHSVPITELADQSISKTISQGVLFAESPSIFNGKRIYSAERLTAMIEYIAFKGENIFQTNLNKLLFYSDLWFYNLRGIGISGAVYQNFPRGPIFREYQATLETLANKRKIRLSKQIGKRPRKIEAKKTYKPSESILGPDEKKVLDWAIERLGSLTSKEISDLSHQEMAYKSTSHGEPIPYEYAKFLKILPPRNLLD